MKKIFIITMILSAMMSVSALAGQCKLQTDCPIYTVKEGQTLTKKKKRSIKATIDYFIEHPEEDYISISSKDFPSMDAHWYMNIVTQKLDYIFDDILIVSNKKFVLNTIPCFLTSESKVDGITNFCFKNLHVREALEIQDFLNQTYRQLPELGIHNGTDQIEALKKIDNFVCDLVTYDENYQGDFIHIFSTRRGVCTDYAMLVKALAQGASIEAYYIASNTENHAWNQIFIDGIAYELDSCFNDLNNNHDLFMLTRNQMSKTNNHKFIDEKY